jgi:hypothetical protein
MGIYPDWLGPSMDVVAANPPPDVTGLGYAARPPEVAGLEYQPVLYPPEVTGLEYVE